VTLKRSGQFPAMMTHMTAVGERAGQLEQMLERVATTYENEVDMRLTRLTSMLEPLMLVAMGGSVAFVVFSILQPIMSMGSFGGK
jgi:general secretion pathway protein F